MTRDRRTRQDETSTNKRKKIIHNYIAFRQCITKSYQSICRSLKGLFHIACLARVVSWFAFVDAIFMGHENGSKQRPTKRRRLQGMLDETDPLSYSYKFSCSKKEVMIFKIWRIILLGPVYCQVHFSKACLKCTFLIKKRFCLRNTIRRLKS